MGQKLVRPRRNRLILGNLGSIPNCSTIMKSWESGLFQLFAKQPAVTGSQVQILYSSPKKGWEMLSKEQQDIIENSIWVVNTALKKQGLQADSDLRQSAILYMCRCLQRFDPNRGIKWTTYAYKNVFLYIKRQHRKEIERNSHLINEDIFDLDPSVYERQQEIEFDFSKCRVEKIMKICTNEEKTILNLKMKGYKCEEISKIMCFSTSKTNVCMQNIKKKAREIDFL